MATWKFHLASQSNGKENRNIAECGKKDGKYGALRSVKLKEFALYEECNQCITCLGRAKELGLI